MHPSLAVLDIYSEKKHNAVGHVVLIVLCQVKMAEADVEDSARKNRKKESFYTE